MKISIIIPVYNAVEDLKLCVKSILENVNFDTTSVLLIDDCSNEETAQYIKTISENEKIRTIKNEENLGFIKTCNKGLETENADIYILLNSDTILPKNFSEKIIECFKSDENIGIASPVASFSSRYYFLKPNNMTLEDINQRLEKVHKTTYPSVPSCEGFCFCIKQSTIDKIGYLDTIYGKGYHEEIDYSYRAVKDGIKCVLIDNMYVYHKNNSSFGNKKRNEYIKINSKIFNERWGDFRERWINANNHINPIKQIRKEFFNGKFITNCEKAVLVNLFGKLLKFRKKS